MSPPLQSGGGSAHRGATPSLGKVLSILGNPVSTWCFLLIIGGYLLLCKISVVKLVPQKQRALFKLVFIQLGRNK